MVASRILIMLVAFTFLFAACSSLDGVQTNDFSIGGGSSNSDGPSQNVPSTGGVSLSFVEGSPPTEMFKGQDYTFSFIFTNDQKHEITDLVLRSRGFDRGFVNGLFSQQQIASIPKANDLSGSGVYSNLIVSGVSVEGFTGDYNFNPVFDYCYTAQTTFREQVCVPSVRNQCDLQVNSAREENGPVQVQLSGIQLVDGKILLPLEIRNRGAGTVVNSCFSTTNDYQRSFQISSIKLGSQDGECRSTSSQEIALIEEKATVLCTFDRASDSEEAYISQVVVDLKYKYEQGVSLDIEVKDIDEFLN